MKKLLCVLGIVAMCFAGCDNDSDNDLNFNDICAGIYAEWDFSSLDADKQAQLEAAHKEGCLALYESMPVCQSESYNYYKCLYVDTPMSTFDALKDREEACYEESSVEEADECVENVWKDSPCYNVEEASKECYSKNKAAFDAWNESSEETALSKFYGLLDQWELRDDHIAEQ